MSFAALSDVTGRSNAEAGAARDSDRSLIVSAARSDTWARDNAGLTWAEVTKHRPVSTKCPQEMSASEANTKLQDRIRFKN